ncbi:MAG TPA: acetyltransferase [Bryobacteraceae bacterium]|nr:acetyltransferase [Bryobacteraceae bacterium]
MKAMIVGAGAQGRVILDILRAEARFESVAFVDDDPAKRGLLVNGTPVGCAIEEALAGGGVEMIVALGDPDRRRAVAARIASRGIPLLNAVHPSAVVAPSAALGCGIMIGANAVVNSNARIGDTVIINTAAVVEHDCVIAPGAAVGPGARVGGRVTIGECAFIGSGATILSRVAIGARTVVGAGAVVTKSLPELVLALGVPARIAERLDANFDWSRVL